MNIKIILCIVFTFVAAFGISGINFDGFIKTNRVLEARVLAITLSLALGYLLTEFVLLFLNI